MYLVSLGKSLNLGYFNPLLTVSYFRLLERLLLLQGSWRKNTPQFWPAQYRYRLSFFEMIPESKNELILESR